MAFREVFEETNTPVMIEVGSKKKGPFPRVHRPVVILSYTPGNPEQGRTSFCAQGVKWRFESRVSPQTIDRIFRRRA